MMMMQNAQMHQLFMQQMLMKGMQTEKEPQTIVVEQPPRSPEHPQIITVSSLLTLTPQPHFRGLIKTDSPIC